VFPFRDPRHTDAEHFLKVQRWRREHGMPDRVFARIDASDRGAAQQEDDGTAARDSDRKPARKPLPVAFDSWLSLQLLEQLALSAASRLVLTECSPDLHELWLRDEHGRPHVSEFLIELYDAARSQRG